MARPFSVDKLAFAGDAFPVTDRIDVQGSALADFSGSQARSRVCDRVDRAPQPPMWIVGTGRELGTLGEPAAYRSELTLAPDETRVAVGIGDPVRVAPTAASGHRHQAWRRVAAAALVLTVQSFPLVRQHTRRLFDRGHQRTAGETGAAPGERCRR